MMNATWQPVLRGPSCVLRPLRRQDFAPLYEEAKDPAVWEQHPVKERYRKDHFVTFFEGALACGGALAVVQGSTGNVVGTTRFTHVEDDGDAVEIGYTFLARPLWGTGLNAELKALLIPHALRYRAKAFFRVWEGNIRSQRALEKLGLAKPPSTKLDVVNGRDIVSFLYVVTRDAWPALSAAGRPLSIPTHAKAASHRAALVDEVCGLLSRSGANPVLRVAIDGVDGAGKTTFADELGVALAGAGVPVIRASIDGFHNPRAVRYRQGRDSPRGFFEDSYDYANFAKS